METNELREHLRILDLPLRRGPGWLRTKSGSKLAGVGEHEMSVRDADAVVAAVNALPALLDERDRLAAEVETWRESARIAEQNHEDSMRHAEEYFRRAERAEAERDRALAAESRASELEARVRGCQRWEIEPFGIDLRTVGDSQGEWIKASDIDSVLGAIGREG